MSGWGCDGGGGRTRMELDDQRMKERIKTSQGVREWQVNTTMTLLVDIFGIIYS